MKKKTANLNEEYSEKELQRIGNTAKSALIWSIVISMVAVIIHTFTG